MLLLLTLLHCIFSCETMIRFPSSPQRTTLSPVFSGHTSQASMVEDCLSLLVCVFRFLNNFKVPKIQHTVLIFYCCCWACLLYDTPDVRLHVTFHIFPVITLLQLAEICCCGKWDLATVRWNSLKVLFIPYQFNSMQIIYLFCTSKLFCWTW